MVTVIFPSQFRKILDDKLTHVSNGSNLSEVLQNICNQNKNLQKHVFLDSGQLSPYIAFTIQGEQNIFTSKVSETVSIKSGDVIEIILPMAGG